MRNSNEKKSKQLGEPHGTAAARLRKMVLFSLLVEFKRNGCYRCKAPIDEIRDLSMEHMEPWLDSGDPVGRFFDLSNVAFSHLDCNIAAARRQTSALSPEERRARALKTMRAAQRKLYTPERRRQKYEEFGY